MPCSVRAAAISRTTPVESAVAFCAATMRTSTAVALVSVLALAVAAVELDRLTDSILAVPGVEVASALWMLA
jgi:hypothetical protein